MSFFNVITLAKKARDLSYVLHTGEYIRTRYEERYKSFEESNLFFAGGRRDIQIMIKDNEK